MGRNGTGFFLNISKKRTTFGWLFFVIVVVVGRGDKTNIIAAGPFLLIGLFLRCLAAGTIKKNEVLTTSGPYKFCRHPLYLGSFFIATGLVIASAHPLTFVYFIILFPMTYIPAMFSEEKFLQSRFGNAYLDYKKKVPMLLPKVLRINLVENFSWRQLLKNEEYLNIVAVFAVIIILLIKAYFVSLK